MDYLTLALVVVMVILIADHKTKIKIVYKEIEDLNHELDVIYAVVNGNSRTISKLNEKGVENND